MKQNRKKLKNDFSFFAKQNLNHLFFPKSSAKEEISDFSVLKNLCNAIENLEEIKNEAQLFFITFQYNNDGKFAEKIVMQ